MTLDEDAETTVDGARRENDSNGQNSHHDGKERLLVREKGRREQREGRSRDTRRLVSSGRVRQSRNS